MRMDGQEESSNVDDVRGSGGGGGGIGLGGGGLGIGAVAVALIAGWIFGINPLTVLGLLSGGGQTQQQARPQPHATPANDAQARFVSQVLRSTEQVWTDVFQASGKTYQAPRLTLYTEATPTGCGQGQAAMGPFYCPEDRRVYLDMNFFQVMQQQLGAPGQFAQAYVVAHEVGHHVQKLLGISDRVDAERQRDSQVEANALSVKVELQADCYAGVWAKRSQSEQGWRLEDGDIDTALNAASQIGDDTLQQKARGRVVPDSFTHGSSAQRVGWFKRGFGSGDPNDCNTFRSQP